MVKITNRSGDSKSRLTVPVSILSSWQDLATVEEEDEVIPPDREGSNYLDTAGQGTTLMFRLKYDPEATFDTEPGFYFLGTDVPPTPGQTEGNGAKLPDPEGVTDLSLTRDAEADLIWNGWQFSSWKEVDLKGHRYVVAVVTQPAAGEDTATTTLQVKII